MEDYKSDATEEAEASELTDDAFAELMKSHQHKDEESSHGCGDDVLIVLIRRLGYLKTADAWEALDKWYA